jgi:hypothetical protein
LMDGCCFIGSLTLTELYRVCLADRVLRCLSPRVIS